MLHHIPFVRECINKSFADTFSFFAKNMPSHLDITMKCEDN